MFVGVQSVSALSRRLWKVVISSRETGVGSARRKLADRDAFAIAI